MTDYTYFTIVLKLILKKYKIDYITELCDHFEDYLLHWFVNTERSERELHFSKVFTNYIKEANRREHEFIIFPVVLHDVDSIEFTEYRCDLNLNHLVVFLYNNKTKTLEYFDPTNNYEYYDAYLLPGKFIKFVSNFCKNIEINHFIKVNEYANEGIQSIQEKELLNEEQKLGETIGLCAIYVIWFIEKRISFKKEKNSNSIIKKELNNNRNLTEMILKYKKGLRNMYILNVKSIRDNKEYYDEIYPDLEMIIDLINEVELPIENNHDNTLW